ncbi:hypothetical protein ACFWWM_04855 [Streptomyces sp. NPDC058682]|uniref:hypothetical protein n=1 Tax=Streptomyces sp. NPDC058682 TaxID=3346596 RepID=UPI0036627B74
MRADEPLLEDALFVHDLAADLAGEKGFDLRDRYDNAGFGSASRNGPAIWTK